MPRIKWIGIINSPAEFQRGYLPEKARKLKTSADLKELQLRAWPFMIPSILIAFLTMFFKARLSGQFPVNPVGIILGVAAGILALPVHELLHAVVYPSKAVVAIGLIPKQLTAVALASYPLKKRRFILMSLLPYVLGIIPLILFWISPASSRGINGFLFGFAIMGLISPYLDSFNVYQALKQTTFSDRLQFYGNDLFAVPEEEQDRFG